MQIRHIAWSSLKRRKGRFGFMMAAVVLGIGTVVALVSLSRAMQEEVGDELDRFGANIIATPKSRALDLGHGALAFGGVTVDATELTLADAARVRTIHHRRRISAVAPKLVGTVIVNGRQALAIGVVFRQERGIKSWWQVEGRVADQPDEVMLGADAARELAVGVGGAVVIGGAAPQHATVVGVIAPSGSVEDRAILAEIGVVQRALDRDGAVSFIEISALCKGCPIDEIVNQVAAVLPNAQVSPIRQAVAARERAVLQFTRFGYAVSAVVLLVGALVVLTTTMSAVTERTQELGILRAVGFRRWQIARVVLFETVAAAAAGGLAGWVLGTAAARLSGPALAQLTEPVPADWTLALLALGLSILIGAGGGTYPAMRATRMDPSLALRHF